jgi:serine/threonine-protein kinase
MAEVWEADDELLQRRVAIKILHPHLRNAAMIERFRAEGLATARLRHPAIVTVFDTIARPDVEAIVMELVEGRTLRFVLDQRGTLPIDRAVNMAATVAEALHAAHMNGVVHRDVKPANIILSRDGAIKITDFGIAKSDFALDLTDTGTYLGTARYVAPEQVRGERATARSDIYGLGTVLFEALAGHSPYVADHDDALALARLHRDAPSVRASRPDVSPVLEAIIARSLARDPHDRYPTAAALADALRRSAALRARGRRPRPDAVATARPDGDACPRVPTHEPRGPRRDHGRGPRRSLPCAGRHRSPQLRRAIATIVMVRSSSARRARVRIARGKSHHGQPPRKTRRSTRQSRSGPLLPLQAARAYSRSRAARA